MSIWEQHCYTTCATAVETDQVKGEQCPGCQATTGDANAISCNGSCQSRSGPAERGQVSSKRLFSKATGGFSSETQGRQQAATHVHEEEDFPLQPLQRQVQL